LGTGKFPREEISYPVRIRNISRTKGAHGPLHTLALFRSAQESQISMPADTNLVRVVVLYSAGWPAGLDPPTNGGPKRRSRLRRRSCTRRALSRARLVEGVDHAAYEERTRRRAAYEMVREERLALQTVAAPLGISRARTRSLGPSEKGGAGRRWRRGGLRGAARCASGARADTDGRVLFSGHVAQGFSQSDFYRRLGSLSI